MQQRQKLLRTCRQARRDVDAALAILRRAKGWGIWDFLGGGAVSSLVKRRRIKEVEDIMLRVRSDLGDLRRDLSGVQFTGFDQSAFRIIFDIAIDNIFTDYRVLKEIGKAQSELESLQMHLRKLEDQLQRS